MHLFDALPKLPSGEEDGVRFAAEPISGYERYHVARDARGDPAILITGLTAQAPERPAPIVLEHLTVQADVECMIERADGKHYRDRCAVVRCRDGDRRLQEYFLRSAAGVVVSVGSEPTPKEIREAVGTLVELFRVMAEAPRKSIQGLWAELFVMWQATDPLRLVRTWHTEPEERYDFCAGAQRLEVKSASRRQRTHQFSLEQLRPARTARVVIASLFVEPSAGGTSLGDLSEAIRARIAQDPEACLRFDTVVAKSLGSAWRSAAESRFDTELAGESLRFFGADAIPAVPLPVPPDVTEIHFRSNLSRSESLDAAVLSAEGGIFAACVARTRGHGGRRR